MILIGSPLKNKLKKNHRSAPLRTAEACNDSAARNIHSSKSQKTDLICGAPDLLVDFCHWQIQANDFIVHKELQKTEWHHFNIQQTAHLPKVNEKIETIRSWSVLAKRRILPPCHCRPQAAPPGHSLGRSCSWCLSSAGQCQARCCCKGFLACGPAGSPPAEDPSPALQRTLSPHSPPKHKGGTELFSWGQNFTDPDVSSVFRLKCTMGKGNSQDKWCCTASQRWTRVSCSRPGCTALQSLCTPPWRLWFQTRSLRAAQSWHWCFKHTLTHALGFVLLDLSQRRPVVMSSSISSSMSWVSSMSLVRWTTSFLRHR